MKLCCSSGAAPVLARPQCGEQLLAAAVHSFVKEEILDSSPIGWAPLAPLAPLADASPSPAPPPRSFSSCSTELPGWAEWPELDFEDDDAPGAQLCQCLGVKKITSGNFGFVFAMRLCFWQWGQRRSFS